MDDRMLTWLGGAARECRETAGLRRIQIASQAGLDTDVTIRRFEEGKTWPRKLDHILAVYADSCSIRDARDIWQKALDNWRKND